MSLFRSGYGRQSLKKVESERRPNRFLSENGRGIPPRHHSVRLAPLAPVEIQTIGKYRLIKTIGKGNFAKVKLAKHVPTGRQVAIKVIDKTMLSSTTKAKLWREVRIMKSLDHPNIVKLFEVMETDRYLYLVMEYASGGELFDYLTTHGRLKEKEARVKFRQILSAVHYFHQKNIVHRDLKAENLLLDQDLNIKIADFGFSNEFCLGSKLDTFCGSPPYAAPELFLGKRYIGPEVDVWSLGVVLYTLTTGSLPFDGHNLKELREKIIKGKFKVPFFVTSECEHLLKKFLVTNPSKRILLETAMKDKWVNQSYEGLELKPYKEPSEVLDEERIDIMINMGFTRVEVCRSLNMHSYDDTMATYLLLKVKPMLDNSSSYTWSNISLGRSNTVIAPRPPVAQPHPSTTRTPSHPACVGTNAPYVSSVPKTEIKVIDETPGSPYKKRNATILDDFAPSRPQPQPRNLVKKFHDQQAARRESFDFLGTKVKDEKTPTNENSILGKGVRQRSYDNALMNAGSPPEPFQRITSFRIPSSNFGHHSPKTEEPPPSDYLRSSVRTRYPKKLDNTSVIETAIEVDECPHRSNDFQNNFKKMAGADVNLTGRPELTGATSVLSPWKGPSIPYVHHAIHANNNRSTNMNSACTNMNSACTTPSPSTLGLAPLKSSQQKQQMLPSQFYSSVQRPHNYPESLSNHRSVWSPVNSPSRPDGYLSNDLAALSSAHNHRGHSPPPQQLVRNVAGRRTVHGGTVHDRKKIEATLVGVSKLTIDGDTFGSACDARLGWTESEKRMNDASKEEKKPPEKNESSSKSGKSSIGRSGRFSFLNKLASKLGRNK